MNAALYIRVSTEDQIELSPDSQKKLLLDYAKKNNLDVKNEHIYMDEGISGRKAEKRPAFLEMIAQAKSKKKPFQQILVWKFSRFARNQEESIVYKNMLKKDGVEVVSISEPIIEGPFGSLIERIIEWMDEYYSIRLSSEVTRGMKEKARRGGVQSSGVLGYDIIDNKYVLNEEEAAIVRKAYDMVLSGDTCGVIGKYFNSIGWKNKRGNLFTGRVIRYMIQNPVYKGYVRWNYATQKGTGRKINPEEEWIITKGEHEPIVSEDVWNKANAMLGIYKPTTAPAKVEGYKHWLGGVLRCKECGGTLTYQKKYDRRNGKNYCSEIYACNNYIKGKCTSYNSITVATATKEFISLLEEATYILKQDGSIEHLNVHIDDNKEEVELINGQLEKLSKKLLKAKEAYLAEVDSLEEYKQNKKMIENEKEALQKKLAETHSNKEIADTLLNECTNILSIIQSDDVSVSVKNKAIKGIVDAVYYSKREDTIELQLKYNSTCT